MVHILCSFLPIHGFVTNIAAGAEGVTVDWLLPPAAGCPHEYEVSARDARRLADADIIVFQGGVDDKIQAEAARLAPKTRVITAWDGGSESENPHVWISPRRAVVQVRAITRGLCAADPARAAVYRDNAAVYIDRLTALTNQVTELAGRLEGKRIATVGRVFDALAEDLGLDIIATIMPDHEASPSPRRLARMIDAVRTERAFAVFCPPEHAAGLGQTIAEETGVPCVVLDPVTTGPAAPAKTYYEDTMRGNLEKLRDLLGG